MTAIVLKFGGASLASPQSFQEVAQIIIDRSLQFTEVLVVVSAMQGQTDALTKLAFEVNPAPSKRELDMLISTGERISMSLLAMALEAKGKRAVSFTGSQTGILTSSHHTDAKITDVRPLRLLPHLERGDIVIVAGFQGVSSQKEITTLGRGGSDTSAVALAIAIKAQCVEFYKDVEGIFDRDPKKGDARLFKQLTYKEALKIIEREEKEVLHQRALAMAEKAGMPLVVRSFKNYFNERGFGGTRIQSGENTSVKIHFNYEEACV